MSDLKRQLIKLGSTNPELRSHIRPLLDKVSGEDSKWIATFYGWSLERQLDYIRSGIFSVRKEVQFPAALEYTSPDQYQVLQSRSGVTLEAIYPNTSPSVIARGQHLEDILPDLRKLLIRELKFYRAER